MTITILSTTIITPTNSLHDLAFPPGFLFLSQSTWPEWTLAYGFAVQMITLLISSWYYYYYYYYYNFLIMLPLSVCMCAHAF